jgi:hypothetical protein
MTEEQRIKQRASVKKSNAKRKAADPVAFNEQKRLYQIEWRARNPEKRKEWVEQWKKENPEKHAADQRRQLVRRFGITVVDYEAMLKKQRNRCAICRCKEPGGRGTWKIDHCHKTGKVRGLLCHHCNFGLGHFKDSLKIIHAAQQYLVRSKQ